MVAGFDVLSEPAPELDDDPLPESVLLPEPPPFPPPFPPAVSVVLGGVLVDDGELLPLPRLSLR